MKRITYALAIFFSICLASCTQSNFQKIENGVKKTVIKSCTGLASGCSKTLLLDNADPVQGAYELVSPEAEMPAYSWDSRRMLW